MTEKKRDYIPFTDREQQLIAAIGKKRDSAEAKFPLVTALIVTFGFVSVLYGFEKMIDKVEFFVENPLVLLLIGLATLTISGAVYKKLN